MIIQRYNTAAILLHWLTALIVLAMIGMGLWMVTIPPKTPPRELLFNLHKSLGIVVIMITLVRLGWRWSHPPPPWPPEMEPWNKRAAQIVHGLLYAALLVQASSGYLASEFGAYGIAFFGMDLPRWGSNSPDIRKFFLTMHGIGAFSAIVLIVLHSMAAIYHAVRPGRLSPRRMW